MATLFSTTPTPAPAPQRLPRLPASPADLPERNVLAQDVRITGRVCFVGVLIIDGQLEGELLSEGTLLVGAHARLTGEIMVGEAIVHGRVEGTLRVRGRCELHASAFLVGELTAARLVMHEGATFLGTSQVTGDGRGTDPAPPAAGAG